ncbi:MAG: DNA-directed RNA polymerase I subunit RPA2 [archaeon]|nr:DNA-directed RNA polymerase I subunit RPA2 [archaeon]
MSNQRSNKFPPPKYLNSKKNEKLLRQMQCDLNDVDKIKNMASHHIDSFNYAMNNILKIIPKYLRPIEVKTADYVEKSPFDKIYISFDQFELSTPIIDTPNLSYKVSNVLYPSECRERNINYNAPLFAFITRKIDDEEPETIRVRLGNIPIMVKSDFCNLKNKSITELVKLKEDLYDFGGYFIINGLEKLIRMVAIPRRNYPVAYVRPSAAKKKRNCTEFVCEMKCVREDLTSHSIALHYMDDGTICLRIIIRKQEFMIPLIIILKALGDYTDIYIYNKILRGNQNNSDLRECAEVLVGSGKKYNYKTKEGFLGYLGRNFRGILGFGKNKDLTNAEVGIYFIQEYIAIHASDWNDKFNILCVMAEKLYLLSFGQIKPDNLDASNNHEILLAGHLYIMILKEKIEDMMRNIQQKIIVGLKKMKNKKKMKEINWLKALVDGLNPLGKRMEYFLATGNLASRTGLDLKQQVGYTIAAERLNNMRFISHFRSVHRGQFFQQMKTTQPRKLLPESWGFLCPVHTPDGGPCGLLLHLSQGCHLISSLKDFNKTAFEQTLSALGMIPISSDLHSHIGVEFYPVISDGILIGYVHKNIVNNFVESLRKCKIYGLKNVPEEMELGFIPRTKEDMSFQFPGIFLFNCLGRMTRKVINLRYGKEEYIGPIEQLYLEIACLPEDIRPGVTHQEINPTKMLSLVAALTPFCDYNQSPRNMYQCQMAKQTMGIPFFNFPFRVDNKVYRILFPQSPIVRTPAYDEYGFDYFPVGMNAVVAVLAYTGYDMEDAMIINKSAYERGFGLGLIYKSKTKILNERMRGRRYSEIRYRLLNTDVFPQDKEMVINMMKHQVTPGFPSHLCSDGLPKIGTELKEGMIEMIYFDLTKGCPVVKIYKDQEPAFVEEIRVFPGNTPNSHEINITIKYRIKRFPVIGDKFSSRHGQKGVLSLLWPQVDMPFTEQGITPDIIINPHAFPSRMTIGMLIESLAGKKGSLYGEFQEYPAFSQFEDDDAIGYFGKELLKKGFDYYGNETMYSGVSGQKLEADIYIGVVYYQRLRHMVGDKYQARATGPIDALTHQPLKGRKRGGGIRLGEMERDALLAHGISYCVNERLLRSSDLSEGYICKECGELLATIGIKESRRKIKMQ